MARPASGTNLTIAQLQRVLDSRRSELVKLQRQRAKLQKKLNQIDRKIDRVGGEAGGGSGAGAVNGARRGGGRRARNAQSLNDTMEAVLRSAGKPLSVTDIMEGALASGYRSSSANFRGIVNQTLIKDNRFGQSSRGVYELKASGSKKSKSAD